jgi:isopenicillin N synthase-like dioxygenase
MYELFEVLIKVLSRDLGLESENSPNESVGGKRKGMYIGMNYYPPCPQPNLVVVLAPHSDPNVLIIILHDQTPGLQIRKDGALIDVQCVPGTLVVNIADHMEVCS